ncbi:hypothetical protein PISMIDRAFT_100334, partial [Pisolithus microcarpus 441]
MDAVEAEISKLPKSTIIAHLAGTLSIPKEERRKKQLLLKRVIADAPEHVIHTLRSAATQHEQEKVERRGRKRKRPEETILPNKVARLERESAEREEEAGVTNDAADFLEVPSTDELHDIYAAFHRATGNDAVATRTCGVCARECSVKEDSVQSVKLTDIPNAARLRPKKSHPQHQLTNDMLLERTAMHHVGAYIAVDVCGQCIGDLRKPGHKPPHYSLANQLWIGECPWVLQWLTFPEQLLIALLYPRVYVFKLFPKRSGGVRDVSSLQNAMRGNVCTYDHNIDAISAMVDGNLMPHRPTVLASLISITFVGVGNLPRNWLRSTFHVRHHAVQEALQWLKINNPKYYGAIEISSERLQSLPEDDVPVEISSVIRQSDNVSIIDQESEGYVPVDNEEAHHATATDALFTHRNVMPADVVPLQVSGTIDMEMSSITAHEMMAWGLTNLWEEGREGAYAVRHGDQPISDFGRARRNSQDVGELTTQKETNFFERAYPCLFPYGEGGIERHQEVNVDFADHIKWTLRYHDRQFRKHETYAFVCFGILQRRQALGSARIQMQRKTFQRDARLLSTITVDKMQQAQEEEERHSPISDPAIRLLRQHLYSTAGRVVGTDQSRYQLRSQIWATSIMYNPPSLWITINPCNLHDPIAQVFAGEHIDMDKFVKTMGPTKDVRAHNIAADPYAAAKFFHFMIRSIIQMLFGIRATPHQVLRTKGVFGTVNAYFGVVESQGR